MSGNRSFVVADVPGLIEGAHEGHGLGDRFLKHLDRTKLLVHLVDVSGASGRDPVEDFEAVQRELALFSAELGSKPQIVAATKIDAVSDPALVERLKEHAGRGRPALRSHFGGHRRRRRRAARGDVEISRRRSRASQRA